METLKDINFIKWYSGMEEVKIRNAYNRYLKEVHPIEPQEPIERFSRPQENDPKTKFDAQSIDDILNGLKTDKNGRIRGKNRVTDQLQSLYLQSIEPEEEPKHPTSWRDFTMTDEQLKCEECPSKQFYEANTAKIMDKIEQPEISDEIKIIRKQFDKEMGSEPTKMLDFRWQGVIWHRNYRSQNQQPEISVTDEEIKKYFECYAHSDCFYEGVKAMRDGKIKQNGQ